MQTIKETVETFVFDELSKELENQIQLHFIAEISHRLTHLDLKNISKNNLVLADFIKVLRIAVLKYTPESFLEVLGE